MLKNYVLLLLSVVMVACVVKKQDQRLNHTQIIGSPNGKFQILFEGGTYTRDNPVTFK